MPASPTWWCRLFHLGLWTAGEAALLACQAGRYAWLTCPRCRRSYRFSVRILARAPVGKTPVE